MSDHDRSQQALLLPCPHCGDLLRTRILADPVTLIVVGLCEQVGTVEIGRVKLEPAEYGEPHAA